MAETSNQDQPAQVREYKTMKEFWPFYLTEHSNPVNRILHFIGTTMALVWLGIAVYTQNWWLLLAAVVQAYAFAWVGHFFVEKNRPATFTYPFKSFAGDWIMWWYTLTGQIGKKLEEAKVELAKQQG